jgi:hypothetical protein
LGVLSASAFGSTPHATGTPCRQRTFKNLAAARGWYDSPTHRKILPLRTDNLSGDAILIEGVDPDHKATDILS